MLHVQTTRLNLTKNGTKSDTKLKKEKMQLDILPLNANKYYPQEDDTVIAIVKASNPEFFTVDIASDANGILPCLEF